MDKLWEQAVILGENLWKSPTNNSPEYLNIFENVSSKVPVNVRGAADKNDTIANKHRETGNKLTGQQNWLDALEEYNKSIRYTECGSESMSIVYANRANCFMHLGQFDNCLADIELAKKFNYPIYLMSKLNQRKAECLKKKSAVKKIPPKIQPTLSYPPSATIPSMADCLEIQKSDEFGRHVVAKCDIPLGKIIMIEPGFITMTKSSASSCCLTCQRTVCSLMPCDKCTTAMFCSAECVDRGRYHDMDCGYIFDESYDGHKPFYVAKSIFMALTICGGVDALMAFVETVRKDTAPFPTSIATPTDEYRTFLQLNAVVYNDQRADAIIHHADHVYRSIVTMPKLASMFDTTVKQHFLQHLIVMHNIILTMNGIAVSPFDNNPVALFTLAYPFFNHQCTSNVYHSIIDFKNVMLTIRPIAKGEQLFVSYVPDFQPQTRKFLFDNYGFWCQCNECIPSIGIQDYGKLMVAMEQSLAIDLMHSFLAYEPDIIRRTTLEGRCINFLNKSKQLPYIEAVAGLISIFEQYLYYGKTM